jgi:hypothetical protein
VVGIDHVYQGLKRYSPQPCRILHAVTGELDFGTHSGVLRPTLFAFSIAVNEPLKNPAVYLGISPDS